MPPSAEATSTVDSPSKPRVRTTIVPGPTFRKRRASPRRSAGTRSTSSPTARVLSSPPTSGREIRDSNDRVHSPSATTANEAIAPGSSTKTRPEVVPVRSTTTSTSSPDRSRATTRNDPAPVWE